MADCNDVYAELAAIRAELGKFATKAEVAALRAELKGEIAALRGELNGAISSLKQLISAIEARFEGEIARLLGVIDFIRGLLGDLAAQIARIWGELLSVISLSGRVSALEYAVDRLGADLNRLYGLVSTALMTAREALSKAAQAAALAQDAKNTALDAKGTAEYARKRADQALGLANDALSKAIGAMKTATSALKRADEAYGIAQDAKGTANQALGRANQALGLANDALSKAIEAGKLAGRALATAQDAKGTADNAFKLAVAANAAAIAAGIAAAAAAVLAGRALAAAAAAAALASRALAAAVAARAAAAAAQRTASQALSKANQAMSKADRALDKAGEALNRANNALDKAGEALNRASDAMSKAMDAANAASQALSRANEAYQRAILANAAAEYALHIALRALALANDALKNGGNVNQQDSQALKRIEQTLANLSRAIGVADFPATLPTTLISKAGERDTTMQVSSLAQFLGWQTKQFDALMGQWEVEIEVEDTDLTQAGNQKQTIKLPNLAEATAEQLGLLMNLTASTNALLSVGMRALTEAGAAHKEAAIAHLYGRANAEFLGYEGKEVKTKIPFAFTPGEQELDKALKEQELTIKGWENVDKHDLKFYLNDLLTGASIIRAVYWKQLDPKSDLKKQIKDWIKQADLYGQEKGKTDDDFDQFLAKIETGFTTEPGISDSTHPYGRDATRRPRIKKLGDTNGSSN